MFSVRNTGCLPFNGSDLLKSRSWCVIKHPVWDAIRFGYPTLDCKTWVWPLICITDPCSFIDKSLLMNHYWLIIIMSHKSNLIYWAWSRGEIDLREIAFEIDRVLPELMLCHFRQCSHLKNFYEIIQFNVEGIVKKRKFSKFFEW